PAAVGPGRGSRGHGGVSCGGGAIDALAWDKVNDGGPAFESRSESGGAELTSFAARVSSAHRPAKEAGSDGNRKDRTGRGPRAHGALQGAGAQSARARQRRGDELRTGRGDRLQEPFVGGKGGDGRGQRERERLALLLHRGERTRSRSTGTQDQGEGHGFADGGADQEAPQAGGLLGGRGRVVLLGLHGRLLPADGRNARGLPQGSSPRGRRRLRRDPRHERLI